jgi:hypothetical protein
MDIPRPETRWSRASAGAAGSRDDGNSLDLDWPGHGVAVRNERFDVEFNRLADHRWGLFAGLALGSRSRGGRGGYAETATLVWALCFGLRHHVGHVCPGCQQGRLVPCLRSSVFARSTGAVRKRSGAEAISWRRREGPRQAARAERRGESRLQALTCRRPCRPDERDFDAVVTDLSALKVEGGHLGNSSIWSRVWYGRVAAVDERAAP